MNRSGVTIEDSAAPLDLTVEHHSATAWFHGVTAKGPLTPTPVRSKEGFVARFGGRLAANPYLYDAVDAFFAAARLRGTRPTAWIGRRVGEAAVVATVTLQDRADPAVDTVRIDARDPGVDGDKIAVHPTDGDIADTVTLTILYDGLPVEVHPDLASPTAIVAKLETSGYVRATDLGSATAAPDNLPASTEDPVDLAGGTDDLAGVTDATLAADLARATRDLGIGQVMVPGAVTPAAYGHINRHRRLTNRTALLDLPDSDDPAVLAAAALAARSAGDTGDSDRTGSFGPWWVLPGTVAGTLRRVSPAAVAAGLCARNDLAAGGHPIQAPAWTRGVVTIDGAQLGATFTDDETADLEAAGVNLFRQRATIGLYLNSFWTVSEDPRWRFLTDARTAMTLVNDGELIAEQTMYGDPIDGPGGFKLTSLRAALLSMMDDHAEARAFYSATGLIADAEYDVDVDTVNSPETIADGEVYAALDYVLAGTAARIRLLYTKHAIGA